MRFNVATKSLFSLMLTWSTLTLLTLSVPRFNIVHEVTSANHHHEHRFVDDCEHHKTTCKVPTGTVITIKHTHKTSPSQEHEHTHVFHVHVVYVPSIATQMAQFVRAPSLEDIRVTGFLLEQSVVHKEFHSTIFRPPIA